MRPWNHLITALPGVWTCSPIIKFSYSFLPGMRSELLSDELKILDLSSKSFDQFVDFFFNRDVVRDKEQFDYFLTSPTGEKYDEAVPSSPAILVKHLTKLFSEFTKAFGAFWVPICDYMSFCSMAQFRLPDRLECIRFIYHVYSDFVAKLGADLPPELSGFYMWWDLTLHGFWTPAREHRFLLSLLFCPQFCGVVEQLAKEDVGCLCFPMRPTAPIDSFCGCRGRWG
jgi:hypothetical protein